MQQPDFTIPAVRRGRRAVAVAEHDVVDRPFWRLRRFRAGRGGAGGPVLVVSPLSGHFAWLMRDLVVGLLPGHDVFVVDWRDAREVPAAAGRFGLEDNVAAIIEAIRAVGRVVGGRPHAVATSQAPTPLLAAAAVMAAAGDPARPRSLVLMGGYIDVRAATTGIARMARALPRWWVSTAMARPEPPGCPGAGRLVWPGWVQGQALRRYLARHLATGGEVAGKVACDDGADPERFPFLRLYSTLMDLPAELAEENLAAQFHDHALPTGRMRFRGGVVEPAALADIGLLTVEGGRDDSSGPGYTHAAHALCAGLPSSLRAWHREPAAGHFGLFHGQPWRQGILPKVEAFWRGLPVQV